MYPGLVAKADVVGFDLYPLQELCRRELLPWVFDSQRELVRLAHGKPTFQWIEIREMKCHNAAAAVTPRTIRVESWLAIAGGAHGLGFFPNDWGSNVGTVLRGIAARIRQLEPALLRPASRCRRHAPRSNGPSERTRARRRGLRHRGECRHPGCERASRGTRSPRSLSRDHRRTLDPCRPRCLRRDAPPDVGSDLCRAPTPRRLRATGKSQQGRRDSNPRPTVLETAALPTELRPWAATDCSPGNRALPSGPHYASARAAARARRSLPRHRGGAPRSSRSRHLQAPAAARGGLSSPSRPSRWPSGSARWHFPRSVAEEKARPRRILYS